MTPEESGDRLVDLLGAGTAGVSAGDTYRRACVDVPRQRWVEAAVLARDELGTLFFDWLTAVDELAEGYSVVAHLWAPVERHGLLLRTAVPRADPVLASLVEVFAGASWHERETHEMFGVVFVGHPGLTRLLLPEEFDGHPLRKEFVLASRVARPWPGAKEPGEPGSGSPGRRRSSPPGVPDPAEWGPEARDPAPGGGH